MKTISHSRYLSPIIPLLLISTVGSLFAKNKLQPNIIVLMTDDQAFNTIYALGNKQVVTPNMDRLVEMGVSFLNHYATTSISMASRASVMTGMYEYKTGCNFLQGPMDPEKFHLSYPVLLREAGYYTGFAGKFGFAIGDSLKKTGDVYDRYDLLPVDSFDSWAGGTGQTYYETAKNKYIAHYADKYPHSSRAYGAYAADFMDEAMEVGKPFCLTISFKAPHTPKSPDPIFNHVYSDIVFDKPNSYGKAGALLLPMQAKLGRQYLDIFRKQYSEKEYQETMKKYHQQIYGVDYAIGMILEKLEKSGLLNNTIVVFTSDNGYSLGAHSLGGKVFPYEEASKIPLIILDPKNGKNAGKKSKSLTANIDIAPTILDYLGVEIPKNMDGKSLRKMVNKPSRLYSRELLLINAWGSPPNFSLSVRSGEWKYIYWCYGHGMAPKEELFNINEDPMELNNLALNEDYRSDLDGLRAHYDKELKTWEVSCVGNRNYHIFPIVFDRHKSWELKHSIIPQPYWDHYKSVLKKTRYNGDMFDYQAIL